MTIDQLQYFYAVSIHGSFSKAALEMNITQSALSKQIAKLEEELDVALFDRSHRQICLTDEGQLLLKDAKCIVQDYHQMMKHLQHIKEKKTKTIKIAMFPIFSHYDLAKKINEFSKLHPDIHLIINEIEERDLPGQKDFHDYDIYILRGICEELSSFQHILLYEDNLICVVNKSHSLSQKKHIDILDLQNENLFLPPQYTTISKLAIEACYQAGFQPHSVRHGRMETILMAANENEGIALIMKKALHAFHLSHVKAIPLIQNIHGDIMLYYSSSKQDDIIHQFIQYIQPYKYRESK